MRTMLSILKESGYEQASLDVQIAKTELCELI